MAWLNGQALPFTITANLHFSPIVTESGDLVVYMMDEGTNFYKYNLDTGFFTKLASPTYSAVNCHSGLAISPDGLKISTQTDRDGATGNNSATRVEIYTIATDAWAASAQTTIGVDRARPNAVVWQDNDILWVWAAEIVGTVTVKCLKYVISTDTWTEYTNSLSPTTTNVLNAAMKSDNSVIYGGHVGASPRYYATYTVATDTYATVAATGNTFGSTYDKDKLWFYDDTTNRQGYINTADDSSNANQFAENTARTITVAQFGVSDDATSIIAYALSATPWIMLLASASVTTQAATAITTTTATGNGTIVSIGRSAVTEHGHYWATTVNPTIANSKTTNGAGSLGAFTSSMTGLNQGKKYYVRAYAINTEGTVYGANISFQAGYPQSQRPPLEIGIKDDEIRFIGEDGIEYKLTGTPV